MASPGGFIDIDVLTAGFTGDYLLLVEGQSYATGSANFSFNVTPAPLSRVVPIAIGDLPGPDLAIANLAVTPADGSIRSGGMVTLSWDSANAGSLPTSGSWSDQVIVRERGR